MSERMTLKDEGHEFAIAELVRLRRDLPPEIQDALPVNFVMSGKYRVYAKRTDPARKGIIFVGPAEMDPKEILKYDPDKDVGLEKFRDVKPVAAGFFERVPN